MTKTLSYLLVVLNVAPAPPVMELLHIVFFIQYMRKSDVSLSLLFVLYCSGFKPLQLVFGSTGLHPS